MRDLVSSLKVDFRTGFGIPSMLLSGAAWLKFHFLCFFDAKSDMM